MDFFSKSNFTSNLSQKKDLNLKKPDLDNEDEERIAPNYNNDLELSMRLPVKSHITKLEDILNDTANCMEETKREIQITRSKYVGFEHFINEECRELSNYFSEEIIRLEKECKKLTNNESDDVSILKKQINYTDQNRVKIKQETLLLESRVTEIEKDVGFNYFNEFKML